MKLLHYFLLAALAFMSEAWSSTGKGKRHAESSRRKFSAGLVAIAFSATTLAPSEASAYERRDVGEAGSRSAATAAMNNQAFATNNRLEQSGFKLDSREDEQARLSSALASFSYDSGSSNSKRGSTKTDSSKSQFKR